MEVRSIYRYAKISPFKAREITREIQGLPDSAALDIVAYSPKKAAGLVNKTLKSAVANAEDAARREGRSVDTDKLYVIHAVVNEGPKLKRFTPAAMGRATPVQKRTSHVEIVVAERNGGR